MSSPRPALAASYGASLAVITLMCIAGLALVWAGWWGISGSAPVPIQVSYLVSGVMGGMGVLGFGAGVLVVQDRRRAEARERAELDRVVVAAEALVLAVRTEVAASKEAS